MRKAIYYVGAAAAGVILAATLGLCMVIAARLARVG